MLTSQILVTIMLIYFAIAWLKCRTEQDQRETRRAYRKPSLYDPNGNLR